MHENNFFHYLVSRWMNEFFFSNHIYYSSQIQRFSYGHSRRNQETWQGWEKAGCDKTLIQDLHELDNQTLFCYHSFSMPIYNYFLINESGIWLVLLFNLYAVITPGFRNHTCSIVILKENTGLSRISCEHKLDNINTFCKRF